MAYVKKYMRAQGHLFFILFYHEIIILMLNENALGKKISSNINFKNALSP